MELLELDPGSPPLNAEQGSLSRLAVFFQLDAPEERILRSVRACRGNAVGGGFAHPPPAEVRLRPRPELSKTKKGENPHSCASLSRSSRQPHCRRARAPKETLPSSSGS